MRLEPVAERPPQHARCGARRTAFRYIMLAIEEIRGIAWVERHGCEARKRRKLRARPLPAVSDEIADAERACSGRVRADRRRIPRLKIEIAVTLARSLFTPWIG